MKPCHILLVFIPLILLSCQSSDPRIKKISGVWEERSMKKNHRFLMEFRRGKLFQANVYSGELGIRYRDPIDIDTFLNNNMFPPPQKQELLDSIAFANKGMGVISFPGKKTLRMVAFYTDKNGQYAKEVRYFNYVSSWLKFSLICKRRQRMLNKMMENLYDE